MTISQRIDSWIADAGKQGMQQGEAAIIERLLSRKFGAISDQERERLKSMSTAELEELTDRIADGHSRDRLFN